MTVLAQYPAIIWLLHHIDLQANGKPVECLWCIPGDEGQTFFIRHIGELRVTEAMLSQIVANFQRFDKTPSRVPLQVNHVTDSGNMDESKAVGWVVDLAVRRSADRVSLEFLPSWSEEAREAIEAGGFRFVSVGLELAAIDAETGEPIGPRLREISLTNQPAIPNLRPIELALDLDTRLEVDAARLANGMSEDGEPDMMDFARALCQAFYAAYPDTDGCTWMMEAVFYESRQMVVTECVREASGNGVAMAERMWRLAFAVAEDGAITFAQREDWERVEQQFVPVKDEESDMDEMSKTPAAITVSEKKIPQQPGGAGRPAEAHKEIRMDNLIKQIEAVLAAVGVQIDLTGLTAETVDRLDLSALIAEASRLKGLEGELAQTKADAEKQLTDSERKVIVLSTKADSAAETVTKLSARIETLESEKSQREADAAIDAALRAGKLLPAEIDGADAPMRLMAFKDPAMFQAILNKRPAHQLTTELSKAGADPGTTAVDPDEYWMMVAAKKAANPDTSHQQAQALVLAERPEFKALFQAATAAVRQ